MPTQKQVSTKHSLGFRIFRVLAIIALLVNCGFLTAAIVSGSLGGALLFVPAVVLGLLLVWLLICWPARWSQRFKTGGAVVLSVLFAATAWYGFHVMFKFIQPTVWPKKVVPIGKPWVIEGNVFRQNDYNNPVVIQLDDGTYRMYFHDRQDLDTAMSTDGKHFTDVQKLFTGEMPTVIKLSDGRWRMYYFVNVGDSQPIMPCNQGDNCPAPKHQLVSAISEDGLHWTPEPGVRLAATPNPNGYDRDTMIHPSVIQLGDGTYKLYYDGEVKPTSSLALVTHYRKIMSASSRDGLNWTKDPGYRIDEKPVHTWEAYSPKALYKDGQVVLHFTTPNGIYEATSSDGQDFAISKNPVFSPGRIPMPDDNGAAGSYQDAYVLPVEGGNRIYFWIAGQGIWSAFQRQ